MAIPIPPALHDVLGTRQSVPALAAIAVAVGAVLVVEGGGPTEERRLSQYEVDSLLKDLMALRVIKETKVLQDKVLKV